MVANDNWKEKQSRAITVEDEEWRVKAKTLCELVLSVDTCEEFAEAKAYAKQLLAQALSAPALPLDSGASERAPKRQCQHPIGARPSVSRPSTCSAQALPTLTLPEDSGASSNVFYPISKRQCQSRRSTKDDIAKWLMDIAPKGTLMPYVTAIYCEFYHITYLLHSVIKPYEAGQPVLDCFEPALWDALNMHKVGHKLQFARGVLAMQAGQQHTATGGKPMQGQEEKDDQEETKSNTKQKKKFSLLRTPQPPSHPPPSALLASTAPGAQAGSQAEKNRHEETVEVALMFPRVRAKRARRLALASSGAITLTVQVAP